MHYAEKVVFSNSEVEDQPYTKVVEVLERTIKLSQENACQRWREVVKNCYPLPKVPVTRAP